MPVLLGISDSDDRPIGSAQPSRTLHLEEKQVDWIRDPADRLLVRKRAILDLGAGEVSDALPGRIDPPAPGRPVASGAAGEARRGGEDRYVEARLPNAHAADLRLVIASGECGTVADLDPVELVSEKCRRASRLYTCGVGANRLPQR